MIIGAFDSQNKSAQAELGHWKQVANTQRQKVCIIHLYITNNKAINNKAIKHYCYDIMLYHLYLFPDHRLDFCY
jgi:hypothetical protein